MEKRNGTRTVDTDGTPWSFVCAFPASGRIKNNESVVGVAKVKPTTPSEM